MATTITFRSCWIDHLLVIRWTTKSSRSDVDAILQLARDGFERLGGKKKIAFLMILPSDVPDTDEGVRKAFLDRMDRMLAVCSCLVAVVEGEGLVHSIRLSVMAGMALMARQRGVYVRNSLHDALVRKRPVELDVDGPAVLAELQKRGMVTAPPQTATAK